MWSDVFSPKGPDPSGLRTLDAWDLRNYVGKKYPKVGKDNSTEVGRTVTLFAPPSTAVISHSVTPALSPATTTTTCNTTATAIAAAFAVFPTWRIPTPSLCSPLTMLSVNNRQRPVIPCLTILALPLTFPPACYACSKIFSNFSLYVISSQPI
jgi:hypothetical protein